MHRAATAKSILTKFCTSTPWGDVLIYLKPHPNWSKGLGGEGFEVSPIPLTLPLASNTAYCATAHTRDSYITRHHNVSPFYPFLHSRRVSLYFTSFPHLLHGSLGPPNLTKVLISNGMSIRSAVFARLTTVTDRHTKLLCL